MLAQKLERFYRARRVTLLGVGPMSRNCVDAAIELANEHETPVMLIASRRQVECSEMGGGYVNNWSTEKFAEYVTRHDKKGQVILARDHGGPWQSPEEVREAYSLRMAMESAKRSYSVDIACGFQIVHVDPSIDINGKPSATEVLDRVFELYEYCWEEARQNRREILFEIGTEEQSGSTDSVESLDQTLREVTQFCQRNRLPPPTFIVVQTGTKVVEMRNVGSLDSPFRIAGELAPEIQLPRIMSLCRKYKIFMKEHNTDYLSDETLSWHPKLGIHAANVAPEFGVAETKAFVQLLNENGLRKYSEQFLSLAYDSMKWEKWLGPDSAAGDQERALMCGHYVFSHPVFLELKSAAVKELQGKVDVDLYLKNKVKASIFRYLIHFGWVKAI